MKKLGPQRFIQIFFLVISIVFGISIALGSNEGIWAWIIGAGSGAIFAGIVFLIDISMRGVTIKGFSFGTVGLLIGLLCGWLVTQIDFFQAGWLQQFEQAGQVFNLMVYLGFGFIGTMLALRSKREEFSLLIPYVRFRQDSLQEVPILLDSNIIIDGRIESMCETGFIGGALIVPQFILNELQLLADSSNDTKRKSGRQGLEYLKELQANDSLDISIYDETMNSSTVDGKLTELGQKLGARIFTNDSSLAKIARLKGVTVLNLNELADALKSTLDTGDEVDLQLIREGKDAKQAVGYLPDGTMIVVNNGAKKIGSKQKVVVSSTMQTKTGKLIFADLKAG